MDNHNASHSETQPSGSPYSGRHAELARRNFDKVFALQQLALVESIYIQTRSAQRDESIENSPFYI
jgi:hypothetical protein